MKTVLFFGTATLLSLMISGCSNSGISPGASIVGAWSCQTSSEGSPSNMQVSDTRTFNADGKYSLSSAPEGKSYPYRLEGNKLIISFSYGDWIETVTRLTNDSLEYYNDKSGKPVRISCKKMNNK